MKIWTWMRGGAFQLGGSPSWKPHATEITDTAGPFDLGKGVIVHTVLAPNGEVCVVDAQGGGIVGWDLEQVRRDVKFGDASYMAEQLLTSFANRQTAVLMPAADFWDRLHKGPKHIPAAADAPATLADAAEQEHARHG